MADISIIKTLDIEQGGAPKAPPANYSSCKPALKRSTPPLPPCNTDALHETSEHSRVSHHSSGSISVGSITIHKSWCGGDLLQHWKLGFAALILLVGAAASAAFWSVGIVIAHEEASEDFNRRADQFVIQLQGAFQDYEVFGLWINESCRSKTDSHSNNTKHRRTCNRQEFRELYEHILSVGVEFQSAQFMPFVSHEDRAAVEEEARDFYQEFYPDIDYRGIVGLVPKEDGTGLTVLPQTPQDFYWPVHYIEPVRGNEAAIDLDIYSSPSQRKTIDHAVETWLPSVTDRLKLVQETEENAFAIILHHPGIPVSTTDNSTTSPQGISLMVIRIPTLIAHTTRGSSDDPLSLYIYDVTYQDQEPVFLGGNRIGCDLEESTRRVSDALPEISLAELEATTQSRYELRDVAIDNRQWVIAVISESDAYDPKTTNVAVGGVVILLASLLLSVCFWIHMNRMASMTAVKATAAREKAQVIVQAARKQALTERQLNDYIAHEVRNPLSSAIAALSFVSAATREQDPTVQQKATMQDDLHIVDASLQFIDELLRNMLDMHRAANQQMKITMAPTDILLDVLAPVASILYLRGNKVEIKTECPPDLVVMSDRLRLKQIVLNLAMNSTKFVQSGFIQLRCTVHDGAVRINIEDSGPGIPKEKRGNLFAKFQESLDLLNQGTGIGLCLCKHLTSLMHAKLWLDESYNSGIEGCPGTRFVLDLRKPPMRDDYWDDESTTLTEAETPNSSELGRSRNVEHVAESDTVHGQHVSVNSSTPAASKGNAVLEHHSKTLPDELSVLFVDDDMVLRKLFSRSVRRVVPNWKIQEAANGETALRLVEENSFDVIFLDQYMSSVDKQMLGTETARALRAQGVTSLICGLSANDKEEMFLNNGADCFMMKPFPCETAALTRRLLSVLGAHQKRRSIDKQQETPDIEA